MNLPFPFLPGDTPLVTDLKISLNARALAEAMEREEGIAEEREVD